MKSLVTLCILALLLNSSNAVSYSSAMALQLGYFSIIAYQSSAAIQSWKCSYCARYSISDPKVFSNGPGGIQGYTGYSHSLNAVIVSFRGSNNIQNWILNLNADRVPYSKCSGCSVHAGFMAGYNLVATTVRANVNSLRAKYRGARLIITGHSLGGALAICAGADLKDIVGAVDEVITFGQPRVGNAAFANWYDSHVSNTFRVVDYADLVPHVPPSNLGFQHSGTQAWYQRGMQTYRLCSAQAADCANSIPANNLSTDDHGMDHYIKLKAMESQHTSMLNILGEKIKMFGTQNLRVGGQEEQRLFINQIVKKFQNQQNQ